MGDSHLRPLRWVSDTDIEAYSAYRRRLAAIHSDGDPPPHAFRPWFQSRYHADPLDELLAADPLDPAGLARVLRPAQPPARPESARA